MRISRTRGVTLLECVLALTLLTTGVMAGLQLFGAHQVVSAGEDRVWEALRYLTVESERIRIGDYDRLQSSSFAPIPENADYEIRYTVDQISTNCRRVAVEVRWTELSGLFNRRSVVTFRCEDAP